MSLEDLKNKKIKIGVKQCSKAIVKNEAKKLYIARDAEIFVTENLIRLAKNNDIEIVTVDSMKELGRIVGIDVKATSVVEIL